MLKKLDPSLFPTLGEVSAFLDVLSEILTEIEQKNLCDTNTAKVYACRMLGELSSAVRKSAA